MTETAILAALILVMSFTPIGYLNVGVVSITFLIIPVAVGAIAVGPATGAVLGAVFGATSFIQCFGMSSFGVALFEINPVYTFIVCFMPRILAGLLCALIFRAFGKGHSPLRYIIASLCAAVLHSLIFVTLLVIFFGSSDYLAQFGTTALSVIWTLTGINALIEAAACTVIGTAVTLSLRHMLEKKYM